MKEITLSQGKITTLDDEDYETFSRYRWYARKDLHTFYAQRKENINGKWEIILMHREIMKCPAGMFVDHIDRNGLNNQKFNLRIVTHQQNMMNMCMRKDNTSGYTGVYWRKRNKKWEVYFSHMNKTYYGGEWKEKEDAIASLIRMKKELGIL